MPKPVKVYTAPAPRYLILSDEEDNPVGTSEYITGAKLCAREYKDRNPSEEVTVWDTQPELSKKETKCY